MSLAEYLKLCKASGMVPLIGVNYNCHNYQHCNETKEQTIPRAVRQVEFVVKEGFPGAFWYTWRSTRPAEHWSATLSLRVRLYRRYIGNEDGAPQHAALIAEHARAMKAVDPTLKAFW
jgi:hypothetical protein